MKKLIVISVIATVVAAAADFSLRDSYGYYDRDASQATAASSQRAVQELRMISGNLFFNPQEIALTKGRPVKITFQNTGTHTFTVDELGVDIVLRGSTAVAEFTPSEPGAFAYYCRVPGHRERGMIGSLSVE